MVAAKKKNVSKRKKSSWRKHVDISDVDRFLEDKRLEERLGQRYEDRPNEELFSIDTVASGRNPAVDKIKKREKVLNSLPRCFQLLQPLTKCPDPITKRNKVKSSEEKRSEVAKKLFLKRKQKKNENLAAFRAKMALKPVKKETNLEKTVKFDKDLWDIEDVKGLPKPICKDEWLDRAQRKHNLRGLGNQLKNPPNSLFKKKSVVSSIELPHPGLSYNPSLKDHTALLQEVAERELKIIKEEKHLDRVTRGMFRKVSPEEENKAKYAEMSQGLFEPPDQGKEAAEPSEYTTVNPPTKNREKSKKQRRVQKEQKKLQHAVQLAKMEKKKIADIHHLRQIEVKISETEATAKERKEVRKRNKKLKIALPKKLGRTKYEEAEIDFASAKELTGKLRNIGPKPTILLDRYKSLQKRNMLKPTSETIYKKARVKRYELKSHKMGWEPKGY